MVVAQHKIVVGKIKALKAKVKGVLGRLYYPMVTCYAIKIAIISSTMAEYLICDTNIYTKDSWCKY